MPDHTSITDAQIDYRSPLTEPLVFTIRDNIEASQWHPYDDGDGILWDFGDDGAVTRIDTPTFEAGYSYLFSATRMETGSTASPNIEVRASYSDASGTDWKVVTGNLANGAKYSFLFQIIMPSAPVGDLQVISNTGATEYNAATSATATVTDFSLRITDSKTFNGGRVTLYRKKDGAGLVE